MTTDTGKVGVINLEMYESKKIKISPIYDDLIIINYSPLLYQVKANNKFGLLDGEGNGIEGIKYDSFGSKGNISQNKYPVLLVPNIKDEQKGIIAFKNGKCGIISLTTRKEIAEFQLNDIFMNEHGEYFGESDTKAFKLQEYLDIVNKVKVNISQ